MWKEVNILSTISAQKHTPSATLRRPQTPCLWKKKSTPPPPQPEIRGPPPIISLVSYFGGGGACHFSILYVKDYTTICNERERERERERESFFYLHKGYVTLNYFYDSALFFCSRDHNKPAETGEQEVYIRGPSRRPNIQGKDMIVTALDRSGTVLKARGKRLTPGYLWRHTTLFAGPALEINTISWWFFCAQFGKFCFRFALPYETVYVMSIWLVGIGKINIPET